MFKCSFEEWQNSQCADPFSRTIFRNSRVYYSKKINSRRVVLKSLFSDVPYFMNIDSYVQQNTSMDRKFSVDENKHNLLL